MNADKWIKYFLENSAQITTKPVMHIQDTICNSGLPYLKFTVWFWSILTTVQCTYAAQVLGEQCSNFPKTTHLLFLWLYASRRHMTSVSSAVRRHYIPPSSVATGLETTMHDNVGILAQPYISLSVS